MFSEVTCTISVQIKPYNDHKVVVVCIDISDRAPVL